MIKVTRNDSKTWAVTLIDNDQKQGVGRIVLREGMYQYIPKGQKQGGDKYPSLNECVKSLED